MSSAMMIMSHLLLAHVLDQAANNYVLDFRHFNSHVGFGIVFWHIECVG
jgi:hypothetical protein